MTVYCHDAHLEFSLDGGGWLAWANEIRSRKAQKMETMHRIRRQKGQLEVTAYETGSSTINGLFDGHRFLVELQRVPEPIRKGRYESSAFHQDMVHNQKQYEPLVNDNRRKKKKAGTLSEHIWR